MPVAAFEISFSTRKEYKKRQLMERLHLLLISLFHIQIQDPCKQVNYYESICFSYKIYYRKIFETRNRRRLCMDERSSCGLSITGDIEIYQCNVIKR